jgi:SAM-dependent methyltransferase
MSDDPKQIVEAGYDRIADRYAAWAAGIDSPLDEWVRDLVGRLPPRAEVLELGCGGGTGATPSLAAATRLTGVDISAEQVRRARERFPNADFIRADVLEVEVPPASFDAVVAVFVLNHIPPGELPALIGRVAGWLRPGGFFVATFGVSGSAGLDDDWLGVPMFFGSLSQEETVGTLRRAGFEFARRELVEQDEGDQGIARFLWVLATKR